MKPRTLVAPVYSGFDLLKFLCALLVVAIHARPLQEVSLAASELLRTTLTRLAVPVFFMLSGFFQFQAHAQKKTFLKTLFRLIILYLVWSMIYFYFDYTLLLKKTGNPWNALSQYIYQFWVTGSHFHLWYLPALILSTLLTFITLKLRRIKIFLVLAFLFYLFGLFGDSWYGLSSQFFLTVPVHWILKYFETTRNGLFFGFFFTLLGAFLASLPEKKSRFFTPAAFLSLICLIFEVSLLKHFKILRDTNLMLSLIPLTWFTVRSFQNLNPHFSEKTSLILRNLSAAVYFCHALFLPFFHLGTRGYFSVLGLSLVLGTVILVLNRKIKILV